MAALLYNVKVLKEGDAVPKARAARRGRNDPKTITGRQPITRLFQCGG
jgi:hypothetical protein